MNFKLATLASALIFSGTMYADTVTVNLGQSTQNYTLIGTGGTGGADPYGTYLAQQGTCTDAAGETTCTLSGNFTSNLSGRPSGAYSLITTYLTADGGLPVQSSTTVASDGGNFFSFNRLYGPDMNSYLYLDGVKVPIYVDGAFVGESYSIYPVSPSCTGVSPCSQGAVGLTDGGTIYGPVTGRILFDSTSAVPEPEWLALGGMIPGAFMMLRRRFVRAA